MKLHITSDGSGKTTKVTTANGEDISRYIRVLTIRIEAGAFNKAQVEIDGEFADFSVDTLAEFVPHKKAWSRLTERFANFVSRVRSYFRNG